jgi:hypothetical protein
MCIVIPDFMLLFFVQGYHTLKQLSNPDLHYGFIIFLECRRGVLVGVQMK